MEQFIQPELEFIRFESGDIITASGGNETEQLPVGQKSNSQAVDKLKQLLK